MPHRGGSPILGEEKAAMKTISAIHYHHHVFLTSLFLSLLVIFTDNISLVIAKSKNKDFDFFYFVQQWPGSYCDTARSCCYPTTGKPAADFGIHGLWPNYKDGSYPSNCDSNNDFDPSNIADLTDSMQTNWPTLACPSGDGLKFWKHEWEKHGTCSESVLDQHGYFKAALDLKKRMDLLQILQNAGIEPNDDFYSLRSIREAIKDAAGYTPGIECNIDEEGNSQLYQIYLCVDTSGSDFIECPLLPKGRCSSQIQFPNFGGRGEEQTTSDLKPEL